MDAVKAIIAVSSIIMGIFVSVGFLAAVVAIHRVAAGQEEFMD